MTGKFVRWWWLTRGREKEEQGKNSEVNLHEVAAGIMDYLQDIAGKVSGEQVNVLGRILLGVFDSYITPEMSAEYRQQLKVLRRDANVLNPPTKHAADAVMLSDLCKLWKRAAHTRLEARERQAIEILTVAFATTSRVAEIIALTVDDVAEDGSRITIRAKTFAQTWQRHVKKVGDGCGLAPTKILSERRKRAQLLSRDLLFSCVEAQDVPLSSADITTALRKAVKKVHIKCRITSHSGRKGAAVTALLAGVPIVVIQSFGLWKCLDSLQAYLGNAVREQFCVLDLVASTGY